MKNFKGKALYNPSGKAGEYSYWAVNFYNGCRNDCDYCYLKKGVLKNNWSTEPTLKKCFENRHDALEVFFKEADKNISELQKKGLFMSFTTDPMLPETIELTMIVTQYCVLNKIPIKILTKCTWWVDKVITLFKDNILEDFYKKYVFFGFTITGLDLMESKATANNEDRINALHQLYQADFKTWVSIEPVSDIEKAIDVYDTVSEISNFVKIGYMSGKKFGKEESRLLIDTIGLIASAWDTTVYIKDNVWKYAQLQRITNSYFVDRNFNFMEL